VIRVGVVAPAAALRLGLRELLQALPDIEVTAESAHPLDLPVVDVLVLTSPASLVDLPPEPPLLLSPTGPYRRPSRPLQHAYYTLSTAITCLPL